MPVDAEALGRRLRQAALGCTTHGHGPLNAIVALAEAHRDGTLDGPEVCLWIRNQCEARLGELDPESLEARRERKVWLIAAIVGRGLSV